MNAEQDEWVDAVCVPPLEDHDVADSWEQWFDLVEITTVSIGDGRT